MLGVASVSIHAAGEPGQRRLKSLSGRTLSGRRFLPHWLRWDDSAPPTRPDGADASNRSDRRSRTSRVVSIASARCATQPTSRGAAGILRSPCGIVRLGTPKQSVRRQRGGLGPSRLDRRSRSRLRATRALDLCTVGSQLARFISREPASEGHGRREALAVDLHSDGVLGNTHPFGPWEMPDALGHTS